MDAPSSAHALNLEVCCEQLVIDMGGVHAAESQAFNLEHLQLETNAFFYIVLANHSPIPQRAYMPRFDLDPEPTLTRMAN